MTLSGILVLLLGVALLIFTFASAYGFLVQNLAIITSADLVQTFGEALAPLIATSIRIMYLGVMGWVGSLLTIRGVPIVTHSPSKEEVSQSAPPKPAETAPKMQPTAQKLKVEKPQKETKPIPKPPEEKPQEIKPYEPAIMVMPPEQVVPVQPPTKQPQPPVDQTQKENSKDSADQKQPQSA